MTDPTPKPTFEELVKAAVSAAFLEGMNEARYPSAAKLERLEAAREKACQALLTAHAEMRAVCEESNAVCVCGCPTSEHENYGEDGESCENGDHRCIRTSKAVFIEVQALKSELEKAQALAELAKIPWI